MSCLEGSTTQNVQTRFWRHHCEGNSGEDNSGDEGDSGEHDDNDGNQF